MTTDILQQAKNINKEAGDRREVVHILAQYSDSNEFIDKAVEALATEEWEYGVEYTGINHGNRHTEWCPREHYLTSKKKAEMEYKKMEKMRMNPHMVRRRVSPKEYIE